MNIEEVLMGLADRILDIDEASMASLQERYLKKVADFSASRDWERAIIVYFMISSVRVKNKIFNEDDALLFTDSVEIERVITGYGPLIKANLVAG